MLDEPSILLEEPAFLVLNKPSGLFTQAAAGIASVETELKSLLSRRSDAPASPFVGLPHRLDRGTSGVLLIARNERSLKRFGEQFQSRKVNKVYLALVEGNLGIESGTWIDHLRKIPDRPVAEVVPSEHPEGRQAILHYHVLQRVSGLSLLGIQLETGRMHQIRIQASSRGFPVVGDWTYGSGTTWGELEFDGKRQQLALHAHSIEFRHPQTAKPTCVSAPLPELWYRQVPALRDGSLEKVSDTFL